MKNILFRGQTRRHGERLKNVAGDPMPSNWVYGGIFKGDGDYSVIYTYDPIDKYPVYSDTVGQYTGVDDKNGKKLFEGDVVKFISEDSVEIHALCVYDVDLLQFAFETKFSYYTFSDIVSRYDQGLAEKFEIIGNIFDNPELVNWEVDFIENK